MPAVLLDYVVRQYAQHTPSIRHSAMYQSLITPRNFFNFLTLATPWVILWHKGIIALPEALLDFVATATRSCLALNATHYMYLMYDVCIP